MYHCSDTKNHLKFNMNKSHILPTVSIVRKGKNELKKLHPGLKINAI